MFKKISFVIFIVFAFLFAAYLNLKSIEKIFIDRFINQSTLEIDNEIKIKNSSTLALAITTANNSDIADFLKDQKPIDLKKISHLLRLYTNYKNIHFKIYDPNANILYSTRPIEYYKRCQKLFKLKRYYQTDIVLDCYGFHFGAFVPIDGQKRLGYLEAISQFNSILKDLKRFDIDASVLLSKEFHDYAKKIKREIQGFKIMDKNPNDNFLRLLSNIDIAAFLNSKEPMYISKKILYRYPITDLQGKIYGWIVYGKDKETIFSNYLSQDIVFRIAILASFLFLALLLLLYFFERDKISQSQKQYRYFYNILDKLQEIVVINDGKNMKYANAVFFKYFSDYKDLKDFLHDHRCVCDFFVKEEGFLSRKMDGMLWTEYVLRYPDKIHYAKIRYKNKEYIFQIKASKISNDDFVVIFIDVTQSYKIQQLLKKMAIFDPLTKLYNRNILEQIAHEKIQESTIFGNALLFAMIDVDHFKRINDKYGHDKGDLVLRELAKILRKRFRSSDPIFRMGGEEFLIIMVTNDIKKILYILDELRKEVANHTFEGIDEKVTISIGVAQYTQGDTFETIYKKADEALYEAKREGRNKLVYKGDENVG